MTDEQEILAHLALVSTDPYVIDLRDQLFAYLKLTQADVLTERLRDVQDRRFAQKQYEQSLKLQQMHAMQNWDPFNSQSALLGLAPGKYHK